MSSLFQKVIRTFYSIAIHLLHKQIKGHFRLFPSQLKGLKYISIGKGTILGKGLILTAWEKSGNHCYSPSIRIGEKCSIGEYCHITAIDNITIGNNVLTGRYVYISDNAHGRSIRSEMDLPPTQRPLHSKGSVVIEDNVWIGERVCILSGVRIGRGAIIGANAVVTHNIPPYCVAAGIPARVIKNEQ